LANLAKSDNVEDMRSANIGVLKNQLSAYLKFVRNGEEVIVCDRNVPIARILPLALDAVSDDPEGYAGEEARLIAAGILSPPADSRPIDWDAFWAIPTGTVPDEAIAEAIEWAKGK
jgi:prevent-host-death family protein